MVEAHDDIAASALEGRDLRRGERKAHELHRGGLAVFTAALLIALGDAVDLLVAHPDKRLVFDAAQHAERARPAHRIVDLEHHRCDQLGALRDQRIVGRQFVGQLRVAALLDEQHLLHLVQHRLVAFEVEGCEGTHFETAVLLERGHARASLRTLGGIFGQRQERGRLDLARCHLITPWSIRRRGRKS